VHVKLSRLIGAAFAALAAAALLAGPASASARHPGDALFVQNDDPAGNRIVVYDRAADGSLEQAGSYATGGRGGVLDGAVVDHLASQGALRLDRAAGLLYAVNAGSDTITVFRVDGDRLIRRQVLPSYGEFPVSITSRGSSLYVLNARGGGSVQGYVRAGGRLAPVPARHRDLGLDPAAAPEFTHTPGEVAFTPDGDHLLVTTKANTDAVLAFRVGGGGGLSARPVTTELPGAVPFGVAFDARGNVAVAEAGPNAIATFRVGTAGDLQPLGAVGTGQAATCWVIETGGRYYASNTGSGTVSAFDTALAPLGLTPTGAAPVDAAASPDGRFLYVQTGAAGGVDAFRIDAGGALTPVGSVTVPGAAGGEGIAAS
jgi:DNA-binding beta-propeller fold protein YncE